MKLLLILLATIAIAHTHTHNFKAVNHNGKTLENVKLVMNDSRLGFDIWYGNIRLQRGKYMIVSCQTKEGFCLVDNDSSYNFIKD